MKHFGCNHNQYIDGIYFSNSLISILLSTDCSFDVKLTIC